MNYRSLFVIVVSLIVISSCKQVSKLDPSLYYFGETPPDTVAKIFAPHIISIDDRWEYCITFSNDFAESLVTVKYPDQSAQVKYSKIINGAWSELYDLELNVGNNGTYAMEAFFSHDNSKIYYTRGDSIDCNICFLKRIENGWSLPSMLQSGLNDDVVFYSTFSENGNMYFTNVSKRKTYIAEYTDGSYSNFKEAGFKGAHAFPAKDESYVVVNGRTKVQYGKSDICVVFKLEDGNWSEAISLGPEVNTACSESCPSLSPDGKYLFFNRYCEESGSYNLYWISSTIIQKYKPNI